MFVENMIMGGSPHGNAQKLTLDVIRKIYSYVNQCFGWYKNMPNVAKFDIIK